MDFEYRKYTTLVWGIKHKCEYLCWMQGEKYTVPLRRAHYI